MCILEKMIYLNSKPKTEGKKGNKYVHIIIIENEIKILFRFSIIIIIEVIFICLKSALHNWHKNKVHSIE